MLDDVIFRAQVQISYTRMDGSKCLRVITHQRPLSRDRDACEKVRSMAREVCF